MKAARQSVLRPCGRGVFGGLLILMAVMASAFGHTPATAAVGREPRLTLERLMGSRLLARRPMHPGSVRVERLSGPRSPVLSCVSGSRSAPTVTVFAGTRSRTWHCRAWQVQVRSARGIATWLEMGGAQIRALPAGDAWGPALRPLWAPGAHERFHRATVRVRGARLLVSAKLVGSLAEGTYRFTVKGWRNVSMTVSAQLIFRSALPVAYGLPALTTRYDYGVANHMPAQAVYLARHASDGLWVAGLGTRYWVPLRNPHAPLLWTPTRAVTQRFGLGQRNRRRRDFGPLATRYQDAPDVEARLASLQGHVRLSEQPFKGRGPANVAALFIPLVPPPVGRPWAERYRLVWRRRSRPGKRLVVVSTLIGGTARTGARKFVIDYARGMLPKNLPHRAITGHVRVTPLSFVTQNTWRFNPYTGGWRQVIQVLPLPGRRLHVRAWLTQGTHLISEIWGYDMLPPRVSH